MGHTISENVARINEELYRLSVELHGVWLRETLWTWRWWLMAALTVAPWAVWFLCRKKGSADRLLYAGLFVIVVSMLMDTLGACFGLWSYNIKVVPLSPPLFPWDTSLLPVAVMLLLQFKPAIPPAVKAVVFSALASFVMEPLAMWMGLYQPERWSHFYSFAIFLAIYLAADRLANRKNFDALGDDDSPNRREKVVRK